MPGHFTFFTQHIEGDIAFFDESETRHMVQVLRYNEGDTIVFTDGLGTEYKGIIDRISKKTVSVNINQREFKVAPGFVLLIGILKSTDRMEWLIEKCVEIGLKKLVLLLCHHSERSKVSLEKFMKTALAALKQSHGVWLPEMEIMTFEDAVLKYGEGSFIAHCGKGEKVSVLTLPNNAAVYIGPEGDFSTIEMNLAMSKGLINLDLGERVLRAETAAIAACVAANICH